MGCYEARVINQVEVCGKNAEWPTSRNGQAIAIDMDDSQIVIIRAGKANQTNEKTSLLPIKISSHSLT
jgi:hypothetical protein